MKTYIFRTTTTMKEYNSKRWWIDGNIITEKVIAAETCPPPWMNTGSGWKVTTISPFPGTP